MSKKKTKLEKSTAILSESIATQWCYVNTENEFKFMDTTFVIDESVEEYKVHNKAGSVEDYTNEAYMEDVLIAVMYDKEGLKLLKFYNQNYDEIKTNLISIKE